MGEKKKNKDKKNKKMKKGFKRYYNYLFVVIIPTIISVIGIWYVKKENARNEQILEPRFSVERNVDEDGFVIWKISNLGEAISNATVYPTMHVSFSIYNEEQDEDIEITLEMSDYYSDNNYYYSNSDGSFYIKEDKQPELDDFMEKYSLLLCSYEIGIPVYSITPYFILHYTDYKGNVCNKIYTVIEGDVFEDNSEHVVFGDTMKQLREISEVPNPDIISVLKFDTACVIFINYENAKTYQEIYDEQDYKDYLYAIMGDLMNAKNKPIEEMFGEFILSNGTLWKRDMDTGELIWMADDVKEIGFTE